MSQKRCPTTGKIRYASSWQSLKAVAALQGKTGHAFRDYRCQHCQGWHLTHKRTARKTTQF